MIRFMLFLWLPIVAQVTGPPTAAEKSPLEKSAYFAFVDRDFIFTVEVVKPGVPLLNFVSMTDEEQRVYAKDVRLALANRRSVAKVLTVETGDFQQPMSVASIAVHPRSSFGVRIDGDFDASTELYGVTIRIGDEDLELAPLSNFDFENLAIKINRLNLGSPDFSDDLRVLKLNPLGTRSPARKRR